MIAITDRYKFPVYHNRAEFKAASGVDAPAFRSDWPIKQWFDPNPPASPVYQIWDGSVMDPKLVPLTVPSTEATSVNLPGHPDFPAYSVAPTQATRSMHFGSYTGPSQAVDPGTLSTKAEADTLAALVGATVVEASAVNQFWSVNWAAETRRDYVLQYKGQSGGPTVGSLLVDMNAKGVGAPGHWSASQLAAGHLQWVAEVMDDGSGAHPVMDIPLALQADEELYSVPLGLVATVAIRKIGTGTGTGSGGGDVLGAIADLKTYLVGKMGA